MSVVKKGPARTIRGIRTSIPAGYVLGRLSSGEGDVQLIHLSELGSALTSPFSGGGGGVASSGSVQAVAQQSGGTKSTVSQIVTSLSSASIFIQKDCGDETSAVTSGTGKKTFRIPATFTLGEVRASLTTAQATNGAGGIFTVDVKQNGVSIFSTLLTIDNTERTSKTAATPAVLATTSLYDDDEMRIDVTQIGDGTAAGLKVTFLGTHDTIAAGTGPYFGPNYFGRGYFGVYA